MELKEAVKRAPDHKAGIAPEVTKTTSLQLVAFTDGVGFAGSFASRILWPTSVSLPGAVVLRHWSLRGRCHWCSRRPAVAFHGTSSQTRVSHEEAMCSCRSTGVMVAALWFFSFGRCLVSQMRGTPELWDLPWRFPSAHIQYVVVICPIYDRPT